MKNRWFAAFVVLSMCALTVTGCRVGRKSKFGATGRGAEELPPIPPIGDLDYGEESLEPRPFLSGDILYDVTFENVLFSYDGSNIMDADRAKIEAVAEYLRGNTSVGVILSGHCDERGSQEYNMGLGERRAQAVRAYLIGLGIDADAIQTKSYGKEMPLDPGHNEEAWRLNRRVEFTIYNL